MQYFDVYVDGIKDLYTYLDEKDEYELGDNVIVPFRNTKKSGFLIRKNENKNSIKRTAYKKSERRKPAEGYIGKMALSK